MTISDGNKTMRLYLCCITSILLISLLFGSSVMGTGSTANTTSGSVNVTQGLEFISSGHLKEISALTSNKSLSDTISLLSAAKKDFEKAKTTFESIKTEDAAEKQEIQELILLPEYYIPKMDFIFGNNLGISYITDGLIAIQKGDYAAAKKNYTVSQSLFLELEKNRAEMEKKAIKNNQSVWDTVIPNHEKLTYIKTDLAASDKDWLNFSQAMSYLCDALIAQKSGDKTKAEKSLKSSVTLLKVLKDSPIVGMQASEWYGFLTNQSTKIDLNRLQLSQVNNNNLVFPIQMELLENVNTQIVTQLGGDDANLDDVQYQGSSPSTVNFIPASSMSSTANTYLSWSDNAVQAITPNLVTGIQYVVVVNRYTSSGVNQNSNPIQTQISSIQPVQTINRQTFLISGTLPVQTINPQFVSLPLSRILNSTNLVPLKFI